ncbi:MAG: DUF1329 domain-containing protein, partial [Thermodesulfobacteriota bacterium]|nr:DUF1329 domain-containing protein [Thermodesulfobacteriota bacterium]
VTDPLLGTDACYDDFECWQQKLGPRIVFHEPQKREMLVPKQLNLKKYPGKMPEGWVVGNCFQTDWEKRNLWVMSADMNDPNYNYSKRIFYIDSEDKTYFIHGIQNYDQKGKLWKMIEAFGIANQPETWFRSWHGGLYKDHITGHSTLYDMNPLGWELDKVRIPKEYFTVRGLLKLAR